MIRRDRLLPRRREQRAGAGDATRLDYYLERDISEVRTRVNALFFAVLLVGIGDTVTRVVLS